MKKTITILGIILLSSVTYGLAKDVSYNHFYKVNEADNGWIEKYYDEDNNVVCYKYLNKGISCLKNI